MVQRQRQELEVRGRTTTCKLVLKDPRGQDFPRGQQHWSRVTKTVILLVGLDERSALASDITDWTKTHLMYHTRL